MRGMSESVIIKILEKIAYKQVSAVDKIYKFS